MTERGQDPIADVINLLAAPIAGGLRTVDQMRRGVDELFRAVENLNRTLESLNATTERVNNLLAEFEEPVRTMIPQLTRTIETADLITQQLDAPIRAAAPNIGRMTETLASPSFAQLPSQMGEFIGQINDLSRRLNPLMQLAENAGGVFGLRMPGFGGTTSGKPGDIEQPTSATNKPKPGKKQNTPRKNAPAKQKAAPRKKSPAKKKAAPRKKTATNK